MQDHSVQRSTGQLRQAGRANARLLRCQEGPVTCDREGISRELTNNLEKEKRNLDDLKRKRSDLDDKKSRSSDDNEKNKLQAEIDQVDKDIYAAGKAIDAAKDAIDKRENCGGCTGA